MDSRRCTLEGGGEMILRGNGVSPGIAVGKIMVYEPFSITIAPGVCEAAKAPELVERFREIRENARRELHAIYQKLEKDDPEKAKIFIAHEDILGDEALNQEIEEAITGQLLAGEWAIQSVYAKYIRQIRAVEDPVIQERVMDLQDVAKRLLRNWFGEAEPALNHLEEPVIVVAKDLYPSDTATLDRTKVLAILTQGGSATTHAAIIARSFGIPSVAGVAGLLDEVRTAKEAAVDANTGEIVLDPDRGQRYAYREAQKHYERKRRQEDRFLPLPVTLHNEVRVNIGLNLGSVDKEDMAPGEYCDLVGLFRTEFLFLGGSLPGEARQYEIYKRALEHFGDKPFTLRTLDLGADKLVDNLHLPEEENPCLGTRALRLCFAQPALFRTQLRAALRASVHGRLWLLLPMVGSLEDVRRAKAEVDTVRRELLNEGHAVAQDIKLGAMIEIPSIALMAEELAAEVDFASLGTNDLCQYLMAADRQNPAMQTYYQSYHPALFRLVKITVDAFEKAGKPLCVCGELGGDTLAAPALVGLGLRALSMAGGSLAGVKHRLAGMNLAEAQGLAAQVLACGTQEQVYKLLRNAQWEFEQKQG